MPEGGSTALTPTAVRRRGSAAGGNLVVMASAEALLECYEREARSICAIDGPTRGPGDAVLRALLERKWHNARRNVFKRMRRQLIGRLRIGDQKKIKWTNCHCK
jgi:hypothetical protein